MRIILDVVFPIVVLGPIALILLSLSWPEGGSIRHILLAIAS